MLHTMVLWPFNLAPIAFAYRQTSLARHSRPHLEAAPVPAGLDGYEGREVDALPLAEHHGAVVGDRRAVKFKQHVALLERLRRQK